MKVLNQIFYNRFGARDVAISKEKLWRDFVQKTTPLEIDQEGHCKNIVAFHFKEIL